MKMEVERKRNIEQKVARGLLFASLGLILFIVNVLIITSLMFIVHVGVQVWYVVIAALISIIVVSWLLKKHGWLNWKMCAVTLGIPILLVSGLAVLNSKIYDSTWDGNYYHKLAIGMMMDGWNPLYESEAEFNERSEKPIELDGNSFHWGDYYAKASYMFAANIGKITGSVESGKVLNDISIVILFMMIVAICLLTNRTWWFTGGIALIAVTMPTITGQFMTNYVDLLVYLYMFLLASLFFWLEYAKEYRKEILLFYFATLVILINIKFSSFAYAGILCACYYGWYLVRLKKDTSFDKRFFKLFTLTSIISVVVGVFVVGLSVYPKNFVEHGHPFYPLMGEGKKDIMTMNSPKYFQEKNNVEKFVIATFSKMDNIAAASGAEAEYKFPFSISEQEMNMQGNSDLRISGNGVFYSGILVISIIVLLVGMGGLYKRNKKLFVMLMILIVMTVCMVMMVPDLWWARYFPQLHFIVFSALIVLDSSEKKIAKWTLGIVLIVFLVNNLMYFNGAIRIGKNFRATTNERIASFKDLHNADSCTLRLSSNGFPGALFTGREKFQDYEVVYESYDMNNKEEYTDIMYPFLSARCK